MLERAVASLRYGPQRATGIRVRRAAVQARVRRDRTGVEIHIRLLGVAETLDVLTIIVQRFGLGLGGVDDRERRPCDRSCVDMTHTLAKPTVGRLGDPGPMVAQEE